MTQAGEQGCNVTRNAWVAAGLPWHVPATSVDRQCGSSQQAMHFVAQGVMAGAYDLGIACGVESMTRAPMSSNARGGIGPFSAGVPRGLQRRARASSSGSRRCSPTSSVSPARRWTSSRSRATGGPRRTPTTGSSPRRSCRCPIRDENGDETGAMLEADEGIRRSTTMEVLAALPPAWESDDQPAPDITAGNSSQMSDAASAMLIADRATAERLGLPIRARFVALRGARRRPGARAVRAEPGHPQAARAHRDDDRRLRRHGVQRGVRGDRAHVGQGVPARPGEATTRAAVRSRSGTRSARAACAS